jgi:hypothetical protein
MASIEDFRLQFNELSDEIGDFTTGITNSAPSGAGSSLTAEAAVEQLVDDVNKIIDGTYSFSQTPNINSDEMSTEGYSIAIAIALSSY